MKSSYTDTYFKEAIARASEIAGLCDGVLADKERLRRALIRYGVPIPSEGGKLAEWAAIIEGALVERDKVTSDIMKNMSKEVLVDE